MGFDQDMRSGLSPLKRFSPYQQGWKKPLGMRSTSAFAITTELSEVAGTHQEHWNQGTRAETDRRMEPTARSTTYGRCKQGRVSPRPSPRFATAKALVFP